MAINQEVLGILVRLEGKAAFVAGVREETAAMDQFTASQRRSAEASGAQTAAYAKSSSGAALASKTMTGLALATLGASVYSVKAALDWEDMGKKISQQTGLVGDELDELMNTIRNTARHAPYAINEIAEAAVILRTVFGLSNEEIETTSKLMAAFAQRAGGSAHDVTRSLGSILEQYREPLTAVTTLTDKLTAISQKTQRPLAEVLGTLEKYGPKLQAMGFGLQQSISLLGVFQASGLTTNMLGRGLSAALTKAQKESIETGTPAPVLFTRHIDEIRNATTQQEAYNVAIKYFGSQVGPTFARALFHNTEAYEKIQSAMKETGGTMGLLEAQQHDTLAQFQELRNELFFTGQELGDKLIPILLEAGQVLVGFLDVMVEVTGGASILGPVIGGLTAAWLLYRGALLAATIMMGIYEGAVWAVAAASAALTFVIDGLFAAILAMDVAILADPIVLIITAIVLAIALLAFGIYELIVHWHDVEHAAMDAFNWIKRHWVLLGTILIGPIFYAVIWIVRHFKDIEKVIGSVVKWIGKEWGKLGGQLAWPFEWMWKRAKEAFDWIKNHVPHPHLSLPDLNPLHHLPFGIGGHAFGGLIEAGGWSRLNENSPGETVWLPGGATVQPSPANSMDSRRAHVPNPTPSEDGGGDSRWILEAVLVMPDSRVLTHLVTKELTAKKARL